jgi:hypothetical protein
MRTRAEAEATLASMPLKSAVTVSDKSESGQARRVYRFANPNGSGVTTVEIDGDPTPEQLADLAANLPLDNKDRAAALAEMTRA